MKFIFRDDPNFEQFWQSFFEQGGIPWQYSLTFIDYMRTYAQSKKDLSFIGINDSGKPLGVALLFYEHVENMPQFSYALGHMRKPLSVDATSEKEIFKKIHELALEFKITKIMLMDEPLIENHKYNVFQKYGFLDSSIATQIVDLSPSESELINNMRHGHKALVKKSMREYEIKIVDSKNPDFELHENYRLMHKKAAGRVTRAIETFNLQYKMLTEGNAILICIGQKNNYSTFGYFSHDKKNAYYFSMADDPDVVQNGASHLLIWAAMQYYKKLGLHFLEIGYQIFSDQIFELTNDKQNSISHFKRGFGGETVSLYRGIKYYDKNRLSADIDRFLNKFSKSDS